MGCYNNYKARTKVKGEVVPIPCGKCIGCRLEKARQWAVRCVHEAQMYETNCFITLTYNEENLPEDRNVSKKDLQKFIKRLRKHLEPKHICDTYKEVRYYACGEYGEKNSRPHYHLCLFNHDFSDKELLYQAKAKRYKNQFSTGNDHSLYTSKTLQKIWTHGFSTIGELTFESAGYVARYVTKKITGPMADTHYKRDILETGSDKVTPEFALMSRMPGIGKPWLDKYFTDVYPKDFFTINGVKNKPPQYYDDILKKKDPNLHVKIKERRKLKAKEEENVIRLKQKENHKHLTAKQLQRNLENGN